MGRNVFIYSRITRNNQMEVVTQNNVGTLLSVSVDFLIFWRIDEVATGSSISVWRTQQSRRNKLHLIQRPSRNYFITNLIHLIGWSHLFCKDHHGGCHGQIASVWVQSGEFAFQSDVCNFDILNSWSSLDQWRSQNLTDLTNARHNIVDLETDMHHFQFQ